MVPPFPLILDRLHGEDLKIGATGTSTGSAVGGEQLDKIIVLGENAW